jgi:hypothetical protein
LYTYVQVKGWACVVVSTLVVYAVFVVRAKGETCGVFEGQVFAPHTGAHKQVAVALITN